MKTEKEQGEEREREKKPEEKELITSHSWQPSERVASDLSVITVAAGFLSPHNDTLQLQDCGGSGDENDDECGDGDDGHDDDVHQHVKDLGRCPDRVEWTPGRTSWRWFPGEQVSPRPSSRV